MIKNTCPSKKPVRNWHGNKLIALLSISLVSASLTGCGKEKIESVSPALIQQSPSVAAPNKPNMTGTTPSFDKGESYTSIRSKMLNAGWTPFHSPDADSCSDGDVRCKDRPEMEACAGTGMANCRFLWKKDDRTLAIATVGEDAVFDNVEAIAAVPEQKQWVFRVIGADPKGNVHYLAPGTVSSNGQQATGFIITNFGSPYLLQSGKGTAGSTLMSVEVMCDKPMLKTVQQLFRQGQNLAGVTVELGVTPTDFVAVPDGAIGQVYQMVLCMDEGKRNQGLERNQAKFPQYQPLSFSPKDIER